MKVGKRVHVSPGLCETIIYATNMVPVRVPHRGTGPEQRAAVAKAKADYEQKRQEEADKYGEVDEW